MSLKVVFFGVLIATSSAVFSQQKRADDKPQPFTKVFDLIIGDKTEETFKRKVIDRYASIDGNEYGIVYQDLEIKNGGSKLVSGLAPSKGAPVYKIITEKYVPNSYRPLSTNILSLSYSAGNKGPYESTNNESARIALIEEKENDKNVFYMIITRDVGRSWEKYPINQELAFSLKQADKDEFFDTILPTIEMKAGLSGFGLMSISVPPKFGRKEGASKNILIQASLNGGRTWQLPGNQDASQEFQIPETHSLDSWSVLERSFPRFNTRDYSGNIHVYSYESVVGKKDAWIELSFKDKDGKNFEDIRHIEFFENDMVTLIDGTSTIYVSSDKGKTFIKALELASKPDPRNQFYTGYSSAAKYPKINAKKTTILMYSAFSKESQSNGFYFVYTKDSGKTWQEGKAALNLPPIYVNVEENGVTFLNSQTLWDEKRMDDKNKLYYEHLLMKKFKL